MEYTKQQIFDILLNDPGMFNYISGNGTIRVYGIFGGGSCLLNLDIEQSDIDFNVIIDPEDYLSHNLQLGNYAHTDMYFGEKKVHWFYVPADFTKYYNSFYCSEGYLTALLQGFSTKNFIKIFDQEIVEKFISQLYSLIPSFKKAAYLKYKDDPQLGIDCLKHVHRKSYLLLYFACRVDKANPYTEIDKQKILQIKKLTYDVMNPLRCAPVILPEDLQEFVKQKYTVLLNWLSNKED